MFSLLLTCGAMGVAGLAFNEFGRYEVDSTHCLDGTPAIYYSDSPSVVDSDVLVIYLKGGGSCSTEEDCVQRARSSLGSSEPWPSLLPEERTPKWFTTDPVQNPDFYNAHHVYVPYCTGDTHRGTRTTNGTDTWGLWFSGHLNFVGIITELQSQSWFAGINHVLLMGGSAGASGTLFNADWLNAHLPFVTVKAAPMAGWFVPGNFTNNPNGPLAPPPPYPLWLTGETRNITDDHHNDVELKQPIMSADCVASMEAQQLPIALCQSVHVAYPFIKTPLYIIQPQFDTYQLLNILEVPPERENPKVRQYVKLFGAAQRSSILSQLKAGDGTFLHSCAAHGNALSTTIHGVNWLQGVGDWFFGRNLIQTTLVDPVSWSQLPCNPACNPDLPPVSTCPTSPITPEPLPASLVPCRDAPPRGGLSCAKLTRRFGCDFDLSNKKPSLPTGTLVEDYCPASCNVCEGGATPPTARRLGAPSLSSATVANSSPPLLTVAALSVVLVLFSEFY